MGDRGPGARPRSARAGAQKPGRRQRPSWQRPGRSRVERVVAFLESLQITSGLHAGRKLVLRPWQREIVEGIYGPVGEDGRRLVRTALITLPRKQGKSALAAALAACHLVGPEAEPRGQVVSAAADRQQAALIFDELVAMLLADPVLEQRVSVKHFTKEIHDLETGTTYRALSSDARKAHGLSPSFVVMDELAQWRGRALYDGLATGTGARAEPLQVIISTQSADPAHVMSELVEHGRQVRDGVVDDPAFLPVIYEAPPEADPFDPATWYAANPALNDFRDLREFELAAERAQRMPSFRGAFENLYLNRPTEAEPHFISRADWDACNGAVDVEQLRGRPCWAGLDLSSTRDLTALVLYFPEDDGAVLCWFWVPAGRLAEAEERDLVSYRGWRAEGFLEAPAGRAIDHLWVVRKLAELASTYDIGAVAYDRWKMVEFKRLLADEGVELPMSDWGQGYRDMGGAVDKLERAVLDGKLRHGMHPVLRWCIANSRIASDPSGARKIVKPHPDSPHKVDGAVALAMAIGLAARQPAPVVYDFSRLLVLSA